MKIKPGMIFVSLEDQVDRHFLQSPFRDVPFVIVYLTTDTAFYKYLKHKQDSHAPLEYFEPGRNVREFTKLEYILQGLDNGN